jgi:hypothetical protein
VSAPCRGFRRGLSLPGSSAVYNTGADALSSFVPGAALMVQSALLIARTPLDVNPPVPIWIYRFWVTEDLNEKSALYSIADV